MSDEAQEGAAEFDARAIVEVLNRYGVEYVVIGAFAAVAQGATVPPTRDIDVTPRTDPDNLRKLSDALKDLDARIFADAVPEGLPFAHTARSLSTSDVWNLVTKFGRLDIAFRPAGFPGGYEQLSEGRRRVRVAGTEVPVADLADVIRSKEHAGRPKDLQVLPILLAHLREPGRREGQ